MVDQPKFKITRREWPSWVVFLFCFTSVLLLIDSVLEMPERIDTSAGSAAFGIFKVLAWTLLTVIYVPETIKRLKGKK